MASNTTEQQTNRTKSGWSAIVVAKSDIQKNRRRNGPGFKVLAGYGHVTYAVYGQYTQKTHANSSSALEWNLKFIWQNLLIPKWH